MPRFFTLLLALGLLLGSASPLAAAPGRDLAKEAVIERQLARIDPALVAPFREARIAADAGKNADAIRLLRPVCAQAPRFDPALRRLGIVLVTTGQRAEGLPLIEQAVSLQRTTANLFTLAYALGFTAETGATPSQADRERAWDLLRECSSLPDGEDLDVLNATAQLGFGLGHDLQARKAVRALDRAFPDEASTHYFNAVLAGIDENWIRAEDEMRAAGRAGIRAETVQQFLDSGVHTRALGWRAVHATIWTVGLWAAGLGLLCAVGYGLSLATLRQIERSDPTVPIGPGEHRLRRIYRAVLNVAGFYYYISLPIVMVLVILIAAGVVFAIAMAGFIAIKLTILLLVGAVATLWSMGRSLFLRPRSADPGRALERSEAGPLWRLTEEVAAATQTRPVDEIRLTVGTDVFVYERGTWREKRADRAKRILVLGAAVLPGFKQEDFRAVLAHEYGHFSHRDTAGGEVALRVRQDMLAFYYAMVKAGQATWLNVAFHFLRFYHFVFRRISHGATRLQEVLADRVSAQLYGPAAFEGGLRHVIRQSLAFDHVADIEINAALKANRPIRNLYEPGAVDPAGTQSAFDKAIDRPTTPDDTHPGPKDRFRLIARIPAPAHPAPAGLVWDLFADPAAIMTEMMATVEKNVASHRR